MPETATADWTCDRCQVTVSWMAEVERPALPATWSREGDELYCLACRRDLASEAALDEAPEDTNNADRSKIRSRARVEFELQRKPDREDGRIAKSCGTSIDAVRKARSRLGLESRRPA